MQLSKAGAKIAQYQTHLRVSDVMATLYGFGRLPLRRLAFASPSARISVSSYSQRKLASNLTSSRPSTSFKHIAPATGVVHPAGCCCPHHRAIAMGLHIQPTGDPVFAIDTSSIRFGRGALLELGAAVNAALPPVQSLRSSRCSVALFTDANVRATAWYQEAELRLRQSLPADSELHVWDEIAAEPTLKSLQMPSQWLGNVRADVIVSIGGGSVIDTAKACSLLSSAIELHSPALLPTPPEYAFLTYFNAPIGEAKWPSDCHGRAAKLRPHIACPTTAGTGSESTGIAIFDVEHLGVKAGVAHPHLRPSLAVIDPITQQTISPLICASTGFDVLSHAIESYTALSHRDRRGVPLDPNKRFTARPMSQGSNVWADSGCLTSMGLVSQNIIAACEGDMEARGRMMFAATLAGIAFGNVGVHLPHAMSYAVSGGLPTDYNGPGYGLLLT
jgi:hydroxyacid-oxoacid transhydrogenase